MLRGDSVFHFFTPALGLLLLARDVVPAGGRRNPPPRGGPWVMLRGCSRFLTRFFDVSINALIIYAFNNVYVGIVMVPIDHLLTFCFFLLTVVKANNVVYWRIVTPSDSLNKLAVCWAIWIQSFNSNKDVDVEQFSLRFLSIGRQKNKKGKEWNKILAYVKSLYFPKIPLFPHTSLTSKPIPLTSLLPFLTTLLRLHHSQCFQLFQSDWHLFFKC